MGAGLLPLEGSVAASDLSSAQLARISQAARDFEAMVLGQFLQPMFQTVDLSRSPLGGGAAEQMWGPMLVNEVARKIVDQGGLGLARPVFMQMLRMQEAAAGKENAP